MIILSRKGRPNKFTADITILDAYDAYVDNFSFPKTRSKFFGDSQLAPVSKQVYKAIISRFFELVFQDIFYKAATFVLPFKLGELRIKKKKMPIGLLKQNNKLKVDYAYWRKTGKIKYHLNEHRNYHRYGFYWAFANVKNIRSYRLKLNRKWTRTIKPFLLNNPSLDFFE